jgi:signal transduction histidine kinase
MSDDKASNLNCQEFLGKDANSDNGTVMASVTDFGTGIDENNIERLFEPFYTTKPEGLGIGLSISRGIVKAHGGTMGAWNNPDGGATFSFTLPAQEEDEQCRPRRSRFLLPGSQK